VHDLKYRISIRGIQNIEVLLAAISKLQNSLFHVRYSLFVLYDIAPPSVLEWRGSMLVEFVEFVAFIEFGIAIGIGWTIW
jgi:hypothetical protein